MSSDQKKEIDGAVDKFAATVFPVAQEFTVGAVFGFCAGYCSRRIAKGAIVITGGAFIFL